jgi:hypothetical protein
LAGPQHPACIAFKTQQYVHVVVEPSALHESRQVSTYGRRL